MPFTTTKVLHPGWSGHHAPVTEGTMNADCVITHGADGADWDPVTGPTPGAPRVTFTGRCRVQYAATDPRDAQAADQTVTTRAVLVVLPRDVAAQHAGARVRVTTVDGNGPAALVGRVLTVRSVNWSSLSWEQDLTCVDDHDNQPGV